MTDSADSVLTIDEDVIIAASIWHDWAKTIVYQWKLDGAEFQEWTFGGNGQTGAHHILALAGVMARAMPTRLVLRRYPRSGEHPMIIRCELFGSSWAARLGGRGGKLQRLCKLTNGTHH